MASMAVVIRRNIAYGCRLFNDWNALVVVLPAKPVFALWSVMGTVLVVSSIAGWRLTQVVRRPELMRELASV